MVLANPICKCAVQAFLLPSFLPPCCTRGCIFVELVLFASFSTQQLLYLQKLALRHIPSHAPKLRQGGRQKWLVERLGQGEAQILGCKEREVQDAGHRAVHACKGHRGVRNANMSNDVRHLPA